MQIARILVPVTVLIVLAAGCAPAQPAKTGGEASAPVRQERVLRVSIEQEPSFISAIAPIAGLAATAFYQRMFNATLDEIDGQGRPRPYLAEALPQLDTDSWRILPDGRMETHYHLKPNLVWHDGAPLTSADFAFALHVATTANGFRTGTTPYTVIEDIVPEDDRTFTVYWKGLYPDAGVLVGGGTRFGLVPFPVHILEQAFAGQSKEVIQDHPYWGHEFVGAGPYKLDRWELGSFIEAVPFEQHVTGRAKIDRVRLVFISDPNAAFANMLAGTTDVALNSITFANMLQLKREWAATKQGTGDYTATSLTAVQFQFRPDYVNPRAVLDLRVHRAFAHGVDKATFGETIWGGELTMMESIFEPTSDFYPIIDRAIVKYPFDPRTSERLMNEAGYTKAADGFYTSPTEGKLTFTLSAGQTRPELPVLAASWRQQGFDMQEQGLPQVVSVDAEVRSTFPSLSVATSGAYENQQMVLYRASEVSSAETRWRGENTMGWANPAYDRLVDAFNTTMDQNERIQQRAEMAHLMTDELPAIPLSYNPNAHAFLSSIKGLGKTSLYTTGRVTWNIQDWDFQ